MSLGATWRRGGQRLVPPEQTLQRIQPLLPLCGITRCADVTRLDSLGIPVYCAIRPDASVLQVSNGKGLTPDAARVSGLMEAIELFHAERPLPERLLEGSLAGLRDQGHECLDPRALPGWERDRYWSAELRLEWTSGEDLASGKPLLVPSSAVYFNRTPSLHFTTTNGLASGNHPVEASLHALLELIERDAAAALLVKGRIPVAERCRVVDPASIEDPDLSGLLASIASSGTRLVLLRVQSRVPIHTFWAVLLDDESAISGSAFNTGWGTHLDAVVAACRAVTEAAQSRGTMIHGSREDALVKPVFRSGFDASSSHAFAFFKGLTPDARWEQLSEASMPASDDLERNFQALVEALREAGIHRLVRCDLTRPGIDVPVVKLLAPDLLFQYR
jgi:ribosomal protein S12 methylthiotransferase accessory factor